MMRMLLSLMKAGYEIWQKANQTIFFLPNLS